MPVAKPTLDSPNLSRKRSAAAMASFQRCWRGGERGCLHAEQSNWDAFLPILVKQSADLLEDFRVELSWGRERVGASQRSEVFVA